MSMHLLPAFFTTTKTSCKKTKRSTKLKKADLDHAAWVQKMTKGKKADKKALDKNWRSDYNRDMKVGQSDYVSSGMSGSASSCVKRDIMTNLHKEPKHVQKEILDKASRVMPLFNKGGLQYCTPGTDMTQVGSKSRRG